MSRFSKLWGSVAGGAAGLIVALLAAAGLATCTNPSDVATCSVFGISTAALTNGLVVIGGAIGTFFAPKNA